MKPNETVSPPFSLSRSSMWAVLALLAVAVVLLGALATRRSRTAIFDAWCRLLLSLHLTPPGQRLRAGCVPARIDPSGRLKLLLIRSRKHPEWYVFPAGGVERGETLQQAAARETMEEAGVSGRLGKRVAEVRDATARTVMYSMHVLSEHDEYDERWRERRWFDLGVPGSPRAGQAIAAVREALSPKAVHQAVLKQVLAVATELAKESEQNEQASRNCGAPATAPRSRGVRVPAGECTR